MKFQSPLQKKEKESKQCVKCSDQIIIIKDSTIFKFPQRARRRQGQYLLVGNARIARLVLEAGLAGAAHVAHVPQVPHQHSAACVTHRQPGLPTPDRVYTFQKDRNLLKMHACKWHFAPKIKSTDHKTIKKSWLIGSPNTGTKILNTSVTQTK